MTEPGWFDWLSTLVTSGAAIVPSVIAIVLWQNERRERRTDRRSAAGSVFTSRLERLDAAGLVLASTKYLSEYAVEMGPGTMPLIKQIEITLDWASDEWSDKEISVAIDVANLIRIWTWFPTERADLVEVYLANDEINLAAEDNLMLSPTSQRRAERETLKRPEYGEWLKRTRLSRHRILGRWLRQAILFWRKPELRANPFATRDYIYEEDNVDDEWMLEHARIVT